MIRVIEYSKNKVKTNNFDKIKLSRPKGSKFWIDVTSPSEQELKNIVEKTGMTTSDLRNCLDPRERPRLKETEKYTLVIFKATASGNIMTLGIAITKNYVLTLHKDTIEPLNSLQKDILKLNSVKLIKKGLNNLVYRILTEVTRKYFEILDNVENELDKLESRILKSHTQNINERISFVKKILIYFRQALSSNREVLNSLEKSDIIKDSDRVMIRDVTTEITQLIDEEAIYHDRLTGVRDNYLTSVSNNLNEIIKQFTVLAALILVPTLIAGIYGMNFKHIPLYEHPQGFWILLLIMIGATLLVLLYFKIKKWI